jgi:hypothetical protein
VPAPLATVSDVENAWRRLNDDEVAVAVYALAQASARVRARVPSLQARLDSGELDPLLVRGVVSDMVIRTLRNPAGVAQKTAGAESITFDRAAVTASLTLTDEEISLLRGRFGERASQVRLGSPFLPPDQCGPWDAVR